MKKENNSAHNHNRGSFSGRIGYVLAVAGSAVGLGNIWRFPYLAAKYGGGIFLLIYILLTASFGYVLIMSETALGRMTRKSPVGAFEHFGKTKSFKIGGWLNAVIPMLIVPYYSTIGGWVIKYLVEYFKGNVQAVAEDGYFGNFISDSWQVELWFLVFAALVFIIILGGVQNGVERMSKIMMPVLVVLAVVVTIYSVTRPGAVEGVKYFLIPNVKNFSWMTVVAAMGQMFYSLSIAMGILYTYGSYVRKDMDIERSTTQVEVFDTGIAILAGLMIIPAVFSFSGGNPETLQAGPSLMFITLPKVFASMGFGTGNKTVYRLYNKKTGKIRADLICLADEKLDADQNMVLFDPIDTWKKTKVLGGTYEVRELLVPVIKEGKRVYESPSVMELRDYCQKEQNTLWDESRRFVNPQKVYVDLSQKLWDLKKDLLEEMSEKALD